MTTSLGMSFNLGALTTMSCWWRELMKALGIIFIWYLGIKLHLSEETECT